jgi:hypothetical protein
MFIDEINKLNLLFSDDFLNSFLFDNDIVNILFRNMKVLKTLMITQLPLKSYLKTRFLLAFQKLPIFLQIKKELILRLMKNTKLFFLIL